MSIFEVAAVAPARIDSDTAADPTSHNLRPLARLIDKRAG